jgi:hypothetical protein
MIKIENISEQHLDYEKALDFLKKLNDEDYDYPEYITNFHIYTEVKSEKELLCIKSWIATQNLEKCKLYIWSDYDISDNELLKPFLNLVNLRIYNPIEEAKGTILEDKIDYLTANDSKYWLKSDLFRILITHKYGGIFSDMDIVYLRDFKPILNQEFVYQWGSEIDFIKNGSCATFLSVFKNSEFSNHLLKEIINSPIAPDTTNWGKELLGRIYSYYKFTIFPSTFFDVEWQLNTSYINGQRVYNPNGLGTQTESGWFEKNEFSNDLYLESFAWHWHNSSYKFTEIKEGSKFWNLQKITDLKLKEKNII